MNFKVQFVASHRDLLSNELGLLNVDSSSVGDLLPYRLGLSPKFVHPHELQTQGVLLRWWNGRYKLFANRPSDFKTNAA